MAGASPTGSVVARALALLGAFSPTQPALSLSELARRSDMPVSTAHRLIGELLTWGAVERAEDGRFRIGLRLWEISMLAPRSQTLRERALPFLEDLCQITRENVQLAVREDEELVFVERIAGSEAVPVLTRVGGRLGMTVSGVGLVLLAHAPTEIQERVLAQPIEQYTPLTVTDPRTIRRMLAHVRTHGFSISDRQVTLDAVSVGAPVQDADGAVIAAVSLVVRYGKAEPHVLAPLVRTSARAISRVLPSVR